MKPLLMCSFCQAMNRPEQERCRACGRSLHPAKGAVGAVGLQRVMGGEVFTAVLGSPTPVATAEDATPARTLQPPADPGEENERYLAGIAERIHERATSAGRRFKRYSATRPRKPSRPEDQAAVSRQLESAARAFRERRYDAVVEHLLTAISKDDRDARSWTLLGEAYLRLERPFKASVGYLQALALDPSSGSAWLGIAHALRAMGDLEGARDVLDRAVQLNPQLAEAWSERGEVLEALDERLEAASSFAKALELRPNHRTARERYENLAPRAPEPPPASVEPASAPAPEEDQELPDFTDLAELPAREPPVPASEESPRGHPARVRTYIEGLDETIAGGIPWGHVVLIEGSPGTMKSSLGFSILLQNAARDGRHGLYLSLEERTSSLLKQMGSLGLRLHVNQGSLVVLDPRAAKGLLGERPDWVDALQAAIASIQAQRGLDLLVLDSLEALEVLAKFRDRRREIFRLFEWLRDLDVTSFVIAERPDWVVGGHVIQGRWDEDFLADGIVHLRQHLVSDLEVQRRLRVVKLRGSRHDTGYLALVLDDGHFRVTRAMSP